MKFYIASSFSLTEKVEAAAQQLREAGHEITVTWWDRHFQVHGEGLVHTQVLKKRYNDLSPEEFYSKPECRYSYETDLKGVREADALIFLADEQPRAYNGANVELGMALALGKPCYGLGAFPNSVMYWPVKRCRDLSHVLEEASP